MKILIVDDEEEALVYLEKILTSQGYNVVTARNGVEALVEARQERPGLVISDGLMPEMDGFELCRQMKLDASLNTIPFLFYTATYVDKHDEELARVVGAVRYLLKPTEPEALLDVIRGVLAEPGEGTHQLPVDEQSQMRKIERHREALSRKLERKVAELENEKVLLSKSEAKYRRLVEGLKDEYIFYTHGADGVFTYVSPSIELVLGYQPDEFLIHYSEHFTDNHINKDAEAHTEAAIRGEVQSSYEVEMFRKNGEKCWLEVKATPIFDDNGMVIAVEGIAHDVTARKLIKEQLLLSQKRLEEAQHLGRMGNWELDQKSQQLTWSKETYNLFGLSPGEFTPSYKGFIDKVHADDRENVDLTYRRSVEKGMPYDIIHRIIRESDGKIRYVHGRAEQIKNDKGQVILSRGTVQDITDRTLAEEAYRNYQQRLQTTLHQTVQAIANTIEQRDPYTAGHQRRVADLAVAIAREMGLEEERIEGIFLGGIIHDIGKIYIPAEILNRPGKLSDVEFNIIKTHSTVGYEIIKGVEFTWPIADMVLQHHERLDGSGYPQGLKGVEINLEARILAVADVVEAISSHRPYRPALGIEAGLGEISNNRGLLYDPDIVDVCLCLFHEKRISWPSN